METIIDSFVVMFSCAVGAFIVIAADVKGFFLQEFLFCLIAIMIFGIYVITRNHIRGY